MVVKGKENFKNEIGIETRKYQYFNSDLVAGNDGRE